MRAWTLVTTTMRSSCFSTRHERISTSDRFLDRRSNARRGTSGVQTDLELSGGVRPSTQHPLLGPRDDDQHDEDQPGDRSGQADLAHARGEAHGGDRPQGGGRREVLDRAALAEDHPGTEEADADHDLRGHPGDVHLDVRRAPLGEELVEAGRGDRAEQRGADGDRGHGASTGGVAVALPLRGRSGCPAPRRGRSGRRCRAIRSSPSTRRSETRTR